MRLLAGASDNADRSPPTEPSNRAGKGQRSTRTKPLTWIAVAAARYWPATLALWLGLLAAGGYAYFDGLDREGFPAIDTPYAVVTAIYFADDPEVVDVDVAQPLDAALADVDGVVSTTSYANANRTSVFVEFDAGISSIEGVQAIDGVHEGIVPESVEVRYSPVLAAQYLNRYDLLVSVVGAEGVSLDALQAEAENLARDLQNDPNIETARVERQIEEATDPTTGELTERQTSFARIYTLGELGFAPTIIVGIVRADTGLDVLGFSELVTKNLETAPLGDGVKALVSADFATEINYQLNSLQGNLLTGLLAVAAVSLMLIGWRVAVVTALFMVTVLAASLLCLMMVGQSLNTITLFALILTLGLLVDDAIVIAESIDANRRAEGGRLDVVRVAVDRVGAASFSGTLTTVLVFTPMLFITGILGEFIRIMPVTVIITLLCSFVLSILFISMMGSQFLLRGRVPSNPIIKLEKRAAKVLYRGVSLVDRNRLLGGVLGLAAIAFSVVVVLSAFTTLQSLSFNIFPAAKDNNYLNVVAEYDEGTDLDEAQAKADQIDEIILGVTGNVLEAANYYFSDARGSTIELQLIDLNDRRTTSGQITDILEERLRAVDGVRFSISPLGNGPPAQEFPWAVQIDAENNREAAEQLAQDIAVQMTGATVVRGNGDSATMIETTISTSGQVTRFDGQRTIEVRGRFDADDTTALTGAAEAKLDELFPASELSERGLDANIFAFDYGQESDSQESFGSTLIAMYVALGLMLVLLVVQFRSIVQPLLILLAIPFGLFGVANGLKTSNNPLSFFVMIGLIGLIGVVVNNTILLTDAANQEWRNGATNAESIASAVQSRFRPLIATTATTVVGLIPLAISDPFWEPLALTIMFGLISSTILVLVAFPFYYLLLVPPGRLVFARLRNRSQPR